VQEVWYGYVTVILVSNIPNFGHICMMSFGHYSKLLSLFDKNHSSIEVEVTLSGFISKIENNDKIKQTSLLSVVQRQHVFFQPISHDNE
jgi:hypothetical protein